MDRRPPNDLERALTEIGRNVEWPAERDLTVPVVAALQRRPVESPRWTRRLAWAGALVFVGVTGVLVFSTTVREAVADFLGVPGISISLGEDAPAATDFHIDSGQPVTLEQAVGAVDFPILAPGDPELGRFDGVFVADRPIGDRVSLVWRANRRLPELGDTGVGLLLVELAGILDEGGFEKVLEQGTLLESVEVRGQRGFWIEGAPHVFLYRDAAGRVHEESVRLAANVLLWTEAGVTHRLESHLSLEQALRIAESMEVVS